MCIEIFVATFFLLSFFFFCTTWFRGKREKERDAGRLIFYFVHLFLDEMYMNNLMFFSLFSEIRWIVVLDLRLDIFYRCKEIHFI